MVSFCMPGTLFRFIYNRFIPIKFTIIRFISIRFLPFKSICILKRQRGSITVEASIIIPIVILSLIAAIYAGTLLYHRACLQAAADNAAERGILAWNGAGGDFESRETEISRIGVQGLYRRIFDPLEKEKEAWLACYAVSAQGAPLILGEPERHVRVEVKNYLIFQKLAVTIEETYRPPLGKLADIFGFGETYVLKAGAEAIVNDPAEFIRNTDFVIDIEKELEKKYPGFGSLADEIRRVMADVKEKISSFFGG